MANHQTEQEGGAGAPRKKMTLRDSLKTELHADIGTLFGTASVRRVYLPQFVIQ